MRVNSRRIHVAETGVEIALLDWGGVGPLALFHHATGFCAGVWEPVAEYLLPHFRVMALDARGHGDSSHPTALDAYHWECFAADFSGVACALARAETDSRVALAVGHSLGGAAALATAARHPDLFARLVLIDPVIPSPELPRDGQLAQEVGRRLVEGARRRRRVFASRAAARQRWEERALFRDWDPRALDAYARCGLRERADGQVELKCHPEVEAAIFDQTGSLDLLPLADRVHIPSLVLWTARGEFSRTVYEDLARRMQYAHVEDLDAGHLAPMAAPEAVAKAILSFAVE